MATELQQMIEVVAKDKGIDPTIVIGAIEDAYLAASRKVFKGDEDLRSRFNLETGQVELYAVRQIVAEVANPAREISLSEAQTLYGDEAEVDMEIEFPKETEKLGRIAAQTAKQVIAQRVREAEREKIHGEFSQRIGEVVNATIKRFESGDIIAEVGRVEAQIPRKEQSRAENYSIGDRVREVVARLTESLGRDWSRKDIEASLKAVGGHLTNIIVAQEFQDLAGQSIRQALKALVGAIVVTEGGGPTEEGRLSQGEVDDLAPQFLARPLADLAACQRDSALSELRATHFERGRGPDGERVGEVEAVLADHGAPQDLAHRVQHAALVNARRDQHAIRRGLNQVSFGTRSQWTERPDPSRFHQRAQIGMMFGHAQEDREFARFRGSADALGPMRQRKRTSGGPYTQWLGPGSRTPARVSTRLVLPLPLAPTRTTCTRRSSGRSAVGAEASWRVGRPAVDRR